MQFPPGFRTTPQTTVRPDVQPLPPELHLDDRIHHDLDRIGRADQELRHVHIDPLRERRLLRDALTRNAYGTASIEGNPLSLDQVASLLARGPTPDSLIVPDEREILNHAALVQRLDELPVPRAPDDILDLHHTLFDDVLHDNGHWKQDNNFIGDARNRIVIFVPTPPERVVPELETALDYLHNGDDPPLVRAFVFFQEFQGIHPFRDGNGRLGRLINTIVLHHFGYAGVRYAQVDFAFNADRPGYYNALQEVQAKDWDFTPWLRYMAATTANAFEDALARFRFEGGLPRGLNDREVRIATWFARMDSENHGRRLKFNDIHAAFPTIPERTLRRDLAGLVEADVLIAEGERKGRTYRMPDDRPRATRDPH